tara:strand:- start:9 stop:1043 length:1035 start_codon:yes stop_codon:yes gene_type:complete
MWGAIIGGAMGLMGANKQAKAMDNANAANMASFNMYRPYVEGNLGAADAALGGVLSKGSYQGETLAGPNEFNMGTANNMGRIGNVMQNTGSNIMGQTTGFGQNANDLYNQYIGMADSAGQDRMATAMDYANNNVDALADVALRDSRRNLASNLQQGNLNASGSGNMNASRAGVADAIARRDFDDRAADVRAGIQDQLIDRSLQQQARQFSDRGDALNAASQANQGIMGAYGMGMNAAGEGANFGMNAGNFIQDQEQRRLDDMRNRFERDRDFEFDMRERYGQGILSQGGTTSNRAQINRVDPAQAAMGGAMGGFGFQNKYFPDGIGESKMFDSYFGGSGFPVRF